MEKNIVFSSNTSYEIDLEKDEILFDEIGLEGLSNTPLTTPKIVNQNVCIDYLKMRIDSKFYPSSPFFKKLLDTLRVDSKVFDDDVHIANYEKTYVFDSNVYISTGGLTTKNDLGIDTTIVELKGQACREFEARNGNRINLFNAFFELSATCKRIDIAFDDFTNKISKNQLIHKINKNLYVCDWKKAPDIQYSSDGGFSITFGKHSSKTLCIYNKVAERQSKGIDVLAKDWMRYESRFKDDTGDEAFNYVYTSLVNDELDICAKKLLKGLIEFKIENTKEDKKHLYRAKNRPLWDEFINVDERFKIRNQYKVETSMM